MRTIEWARLVVTSGLLIALTLPAANAQEAPTDPAINGTWIVDSDFIGSLGACELVGRKIGDSRMPEVSLVISDGLIRHRYKKTEGITVDAQAGQTTSEVKDADGTEYIVIDYGFRLNTNESPHQIDFFWKDSDGTPGSSRGIYKVEEGTLWFAVGIFGSNNRPSDFERSTYMPDYQKSVMKAGKK